MRTAAEWHFPVSPNGEVVPGSDAAAMKVDLGIRKCDLRLFSEGLHPYQDSWSHQGKPYWEGLGHARGSEYVPPYMHQPGLPIPIPTSIPPRGRWVKQSGPVAAFSHSADDPTIWPEDARKTGLATFHKLKEFQENCPCSCPAPDFSTTRIGWASLAVDESTVEDWLWQQYPGKNKVK